MHAIKYVHSRGIVHRDLKLDNVMISGTDTGDINDIKIKLIDFGMAKLTQRNNKKVELKTYCGTIDFIAPEILAGKTYGMECDLWSAGVIAYFILAGQPPFLAEDEKAIARRIMRNNYDFVEPCWHEYDGNVSLTAQEWISSLLELEPHERSSPENALAHPWLSGKQSAKQQHKLYPSIMMNLHACNRPHELHFELLTLFVQFLDKSQIKPIKESFMQMDEDSSGSIELMEVEKSYKAMRDLAIGIDQGKSMDELLEFILATDDQKASLKIAKDLTDDKIREILTKVDQDDNKEIEYSEFLAHALTENELSKENINAFFKAITPVKYEPELAEDEEEWINAEHLQQFFLRSNKVFKPEKIQEMMNECETHCQLEGFNSEAKVTFDYFFKFMTSFLPKSQ